MSRRWPIASLTLAAARSVGALSVAAQDPPAASCAAPSGTTGVPAIPGGSESLTGAQPGTAPAEAPILCWTGSSGNAVLGTRVLLVGDQVLTLTDTGAAIKFLPDGGDGAARWEMTPASGRVAAVTANGPFAFVNGVTALYSLDAASGARAWDAPIQESPPPFADQPIPAVVDGMIMVGTTDIDVPGALLAFDAATGSAVWRVDLELYGAIFSPVVAGERIHAPSFDLVGSGGVLAFGRPG